jgi:hypothetical protein
LHECHPGEQASRGAGSTAHVLENNRREKATDLTGDLRWVRGGFAYGAEQTAAMGTSSGRPEIGCDDPASWPIRNGAKGPSAIG